MRRIKIAVCVLAVAAILATGTALAVTQLYVNPSFKYRGHWVFNSDTAANGTLLLQNVSGAPRQFQMEFIGQYVNPPPPPADPTLKVVVSGNLIIGETKRIDFALPAPITSLHIIRIKRVP